MKKLIFIITIIAALSTGWNAGAMRPGELYVGAEGSYSVVNNSGSKYGLFGINANYSINLSSLFFVSPEASLYYQHYPNGTPIYGWIGDSAMPNVGKSSFTANTFGGGLGAYLGFRFRKPVFIWTGPQALCNFYQQCRYRIGDKVTYHDLTENRANLLWRFGLGFDVWRLRIRASYDLYVTNRVEYHTKKDGAISLGIALKL